MSSFFQGKLYLWQCGNRGKSPCFIGKSSYKICPLPNKNRLLSQWPLWGVLRLVQVLASGHIWWLSHPSEKYESQPGWNDSQYMMEKENMFQTNQPVLHDLNINNCHVYSIHVNIRSLATLVDRMVAKMCCVPFFASPGWLLYCLNCITSNKTWSLETERKNHLLSFENGCLAAKWRSWTI